MAIVNYRDVPSNRTAKPLANVSIQRAGKLRALAYLHLRLRAFSQHSVNDNRKGNFKKLDECHVEYQPGTSGRQISLGNKVHKAQRCSP